MRNDEATIVIDALRSAGFDFAVTLPATQLHTLQGQLSEHPDFTHVAVTNEAEGCAIAAGAWLGGRMPVIIVETSGILLSTYALLRVHATFGVPLLLMSTYRGGLGEQEWYAVHTGAAFPDLLKTLRVPCHIISSVSEVETVIKEARSTLDASLHPLSLVLPIRLTDLD